MKFNKYIIIIPIIIIIIAITAFLWFFTDFRIGFSSPTVHEKPYATILYPEDNMTVFDLVMIRGNASDPNNNLKDVEVKINNGPWENATGTNTWSYSWNTYDLSDGLYDIQVRAWDGKWYSNVEQITVDLNNPKTVLSGEHKWALFVAADNFPKNNESKLGNGGLYLAENISSYLIENCGYPTSNVIILFDDGWIRSDNGYGKPIETLQERPHPYRISYGGATFDNVVAAIDHITDESNQFQDSEVFIWIFGHGYGNSSLFAGGKIFQRSAVFLWDTILSDNNLGNLLANLASKKTCVLVDACYSGGFADKTIFNLPQLSMLNSGIPKSGRVVITGESKFTPGYAITTTGPVFSQIWFYGLTTGYADGFKPGILHKGRPPILNFFKNGNVSVEEAYYYTRFMLKNSVTLKEFMNMQPEINDQYPHRGLVRSLKGLIL